MNILAKNNFPFNRDLKTNFQCHTRLPFFMSGSGLDWQNLNFFLAFFFSLKWFQPTKRRCHNESCNLWSKLTLTLTLLTLDIDRLNWKESPGIEGFFKYFPQVFFSQFGPGQVHSIRWELTRWHFNVWFIKWTWLQFLIYFIYKLYTFIRFIK